MDPAAAPDDGPATDPIPAAPPVVDPVPDADPAAVAPLSPLKPRPGLLVLTSVVFALWVAGLLTMYFTTVYPERHPSKPPAASVRPIPR